MNWGGYLFMGRPNTNTKQKKAENQFIWTYCTVERKKRRRRSVWPSWQYLQKQSFTLFILVLCCSWIKTGPLNINTYCISNSQYTRCCFHSLWRSTQMRSTWPRWGQPDPVKVQQRQSDHTCLISDWSNSAGLRESLPANWTGVLEHDAASTLPWSHHRHSTIQTVCRTFNMWYQPNMWNKLSSCHFLWLSVQLSSEVP